MDLEKLKRRWEREDENKINSAVSKALKDAEGRKLLWWLLRIGGIGNQPYSGNALNTAFNCGILNVGQQILDRITSVSPKGYLQMMEENNDEVNERNALLNREGTLDDPADEDGTDDGEAASRAG